jgi:hypothetical protein
METEIMTERMNGKLGALALTGLIITAAAAAAQVTWKGTVVKEGDVIVVMNPKEPLFKTPVFELREDLSIGGPDAEGDCVFDQVRQVVIDDAGIMYALDERASDIKAFDASGKYLRTIGRRGQGPGELEFPMTLSLNRAAGELTVQQQTRGLAIFKTDGTFLRQQSLQGLITGRGRADSRGNIYVLEIVLGDTGTSYATKKLAPDGSPLATISETPAPAGKGVGRPVRPFLAVPYFLVDREDRLVYGYPETYKIQFYGPAEAKVLRTIVREYDPVPVRAEEKAALEKEIPPGMKVEIEYPKVHPAFTRFFLSDLGHLIVQTYEKADGGKIIHDVFDAAGRFIGRVPLQGIGFEIFNGKYYALEEDEEGYQYIKRYAVTWTIK